jgi:hypothetical protein
MGFKAVVFGAVAGLASLMCATGSIAQAEPWQGRWGAPCGSDGTLISFSKSSLDLSTFDMMCSIRGVKQSGKTYTFNLSCDGFTTSMSAKVDGNRLEFVKQQPGFDFDPKRFSRC